MKNRIRCMICSYFADSKNVIIDSMSMSKFEDILTYYRIDVKAFYVKSFGRKCKQFVKTPLNFNFIYEVETGILMDSEWKECR